MLKRGIRYVLGIILLLTVLFTLFVIAVNYEIFGHLYSKKELKDFKNQLATEVYSQDGDLIGKFFAKNRTNATYTELPEHLIYALVATEDARYFEHEGVDSRSLFRVLFKTILLNDARSGGGSTITQQLLKNMYGRQRFGPFTVLVNKTKEALLAYRLESIYSKEEILTLYLNTVPFGENVYGIETAALLFFNKSVPELNTIESAVLVGMLKANTYYNPRLYPQHAFDRKNVVLNQMYKYEYISKFEYDSLVIENVHLDYANLESQGKANYFLSEVKKELKRILENIESQTSKKWNYRTDGLIIETTLDARLQNFALESFQKHLSQKQKKLITQYTKGSSKKNLARLVAKILKQNNLEARKNDIIKAEIFSWDSIYYDSITVTDSIRNALLTIQSGYLAISPKTGAVRSWVGGIDYRTNPYDQVLAKRQLASTFKPILYTAGLEKGLSPCDYLSNTPMTFEDQNGWKPSNYDHTEGGEYSLTGALIKSKNIPSVDLLFRVGFDEVDYLWRKMGFSRTLDHTPSMALGTVDASVKELAIAYAAFANGGYKIETYTIDRIKTADGEVIYEKKNASTPEFIIESRSSNLMNEMLQKAINQGTGTAIRNRYGIKIPWAGKTGTSQNYGDAWFVGYNPDVVMVSRVGNSYRSIHFNNGRDGSGGRLALPIVALTLKQIEENKDVLKLYNSDFIKLPETLNNELNCPDFDADNTIDKLKLLLSKDKTTIKTQEKKNKPKRKKKKKEKKKKGWFKKKK
jgi:penicillin-binding protein 1A